MDRQKIDRINELYRKSKAEGLTEAEKKEQKILRMEYLESVKRNLKVQLNNIDIEEKDGTVGELFVQQINDLIAQRNNSQYSALSFMYKLFDLLSADVPQEIETGENSGRNKAFINTVVYYIIENYARKDFSLSQISEHFHINATYLSKLFLK